MTGEKAGFIPFARPEIGEEEINEVVDTLRSGWITTGPKAKAFELDFCHYLGNGLEAVAVNSATAGLHLALEAIGIAEGDDVLTTPYTFTATAEIIRYFGANPVFVDVDPVTLNIDPDSVEAAITPRTKAIIPVHFAGLPCRMDALLQIAERHRLHVVEDAAHCLPARYKGRMIGTLDSDATVFSFYANKTITTGEGGMLVTRKRDIAERCRTMRLHGISRDVFARYSSEKPAWYYEVVAPGFKYNMSDIAASLGIQQLKKADRFHTRRRELAETYLRRLHDLPLTLPATGGGQDLHSWHLFVIRLEQNAPLQRDDFIQRMADAGIGCSVHFIPLHLHPYWRQRYALKPEDFPLSLAAYRQAVSLPLYPSMTNAEQERVVAAVRSLLT